MLATYKKNEDLILLGAYKTGADQRVDRAIAKIEGINAYLKQGTDEKSNLAVAIEQLKQMFPQDSN
jgi:flagellar biosynthesis/type III secretory pathway ATPase